jgi:hypothetical protein
MDNDFWAYVSKKAGNIFFQPKRVYPWDSIVQGVSVCKSDGTKERMFAVAKNTWRAHHREDKSQVGSSIIFIDFFVKNKNKMLNDLKSVQNRKSLHDVANFWVSKINPELKNLKPHVLSSYNSIRKPIDLYFFSLVSMAEEFSNDFRSSLIPLLFLPIDSKMLGKFPIGENNDFSIFTYNQLRGLGLTHQSSYGHIKTEKTYINLQEIASHRANEISESCSLPFYPIYFEMLWSQRFRRDGGNIFELNP